MTDRKDILFGVVNDEYDIRIEGGDFVIGPSDTQHALHIMEACPGQYRQHPFMGVGVRKWLNGPVTGNERRVAQLQLQSDGYKYVKEIDYQDGKLTIRL